MTTQLIGSALDRVVNSKTFARSRSLQEFLTFIVTQSLDSDQNLKEYRIGVDALKRGGAFDPAADSIVRVQAYRLRAKLADYYQHEGQAEDLRIDLKPGSYTPVIREGSVVANLRSLRYPGLSLDLLPIKLELPETRAAHAAAFLYSTISSNLDSFLRASLRDRHPSRASRAHLQIEFSSRGGNAGIRALVYLNDAATKRIISSHALTESPAVAIPDLEKAGIQVAQTLWRRIEAVLACNG
jgi:hypothetical protein